MSLSPATDSGELPSSAALRSSIWDAIKGYGALIGIGVDKEELRRRVVMPFYLRSSVRVSIATRDSEAAAEDALRASRPVDGRTPEDEEVVAAEAPVVVFVNSWSGGRHGPELMVRLQELICEEQVFDLSVTKPPEFVEYGLTCLEKLAGLGDSCAMVTRQKLRILVAGGDGTVGWVLGSLGELYRKQREPVPPTAIIPLGTGNDLSRSFGWGGSFPFSWRSAVKHSLLKAITSPICNLDSWSVTVTTGEGEVLRIPYSLRHGGNYDASQDKQMKENLPERVTSYEGVFYNYFSIGMDAQVAYAFHNLRDEKPHLARGPIANKLIYSSYSCGQGWFLTSCVGSPELRGLNNILRLFIKKVNSTEWEQISVPSSVRSIVALNLDNYGSGRNPWGTPPPEYLDERNFVEAQMDDGLIEIFGLKQGWHASMVMVQLIPAKHIAQATSIKFELRGGDWSRAYLQMDGEPWKQPLSSDYSTFVVINRVPFRSRMINGK